MPVPITALYLAIFALFATGPHDVSVFELRPLRGFVYLEKTFLRADLTIYDSSWDMPTTKGAGPHELE